jgi:hypothetical protein
MQMAEMDVPAVIRIAALRWPGRAGRVGGAGGDAIVGALQYGAEDGNPVRD